MVVLDISIKLACMNKYKLYIYFCKCHSYQQIDGKERERKSKLAFETAKQKELKEPNRLGKRRASNRKGEREAQQKRYRNMCD